MYHHEEYQYCNHPQSNSNSGLLRFRSAPTSLFSNFANGIDGSGEKGLMNDRCSSPEAQKLTHFASQSLLEDLELETKPLANGLTRLSSQLPPQYPRQSSSTQLGSMGTSNLTRQSSSPAGLFSNITAQKGYGAQRGYGNYRVGNGTNGDLSPSSNRLKGQMNFSSGMSSSLGMMSHISELDSEGNHGPGYAFGLWNDSLHCPDNFSVLKRDLENDDKLFGGIQNVELDNHSHLLSHHLSLPKTSVDIAAMEKLLHFQDAVPCKVRAKRGCATHPRSIAERLRRTRISERMRKLQELVPNMDKQTNTADMLDLAVDYIKDLQKQHKALSENRANCKCSSSMQKPLSNIFS